MAKMLNIQRILVKKFMTIINCQKAKIFMIIIKNVHGVLTVRLI